MEIYAIQNISDDKVYIGQSVNATKRLREHFRRLRRQEHINPHLQRAWDKCGEQNFVSYVICECDNQNELDELENAYIGWFKDIGLSYNIERSARGTGSKSPESIAKRVASMTGQKRSPEVRERMRQAHLGQVVTAEQTAKRLATREANGYQHSEETKRKMSESKKGIPLSENHARKCRENRLGKSHPDSFFEKKCNSFLVKHSDGREVEGQNIKEFCKLHNIHYGYFIDMLNGKRENARGWSCIWYNKKNKERYTVNNETCVPL